jgi:hypothetical protein
MADIFLEECLSFSFRKPGRFNPGFCVSSEKGKKIHAFGRKFISVRASTPAI